MSAYENTINRVAPVTNVVDDAVGVKKIYWFVAIVNHNAEKSASEKLGKMGVECYLPSQSEVRIWRNGRKSKVERMVIPSTIFVHCTEQKRREIVSLPFINRFMIDKAGGAHTIGNKSIATIPSVQIDKLKFMLGQSDIPVEITSEPYRHGEKVKVVRGFLRGLEGEIININEGKGELMVSLNFFGNAKVIIDTINVEHTK
jgi:transcription antitermination factor NusG